MIDVVCVTPSRGLIHSRTDEAIYENLLSSGLSCERVFTHDLGIPAAQNSGVARAFEHSPHWIWMVEEDVVPPPHALTHLVALALDRPGYEVVTGWYMLQGGTRSVTISPGGKLLYGGLGCVLIAASVFMKLEQPWFRTNKTYTMLEGDLVPLASAEIGYGGHDVDFYYRAREAGVRIRLAEALECKHLIVRERGKLFSNEGCHLIEPLL